MPALAVLTALPIAAAFIVCISAFVAMTVLMIRSQRRAEGRESPLADEFWHYRDDVNTAKQHHRRRRSRRGLRWTGPTIHFVIHDPRDDASLYVLPDQYELALVAL